MNTRPNPNADTARLARESSALTLAEITTLRGDDTRFDELRTAVIEGTDLRAAAAKLDAWCQRALVVRSFKLLPGNRGDDVVELLGLQDAVESLRVDAARTGGEAPRPAKESKP